MKKTNMSLRWVVGLASIFFAVILTGCYPRPESVLEGSWELSTTDDTGLSQTLLTFNQWGKLSEITYKRNLVTGEKVTVTYDSGLSTKSRVRGNKVMIDITFPPASRLVFNGTLNADRTMIDGTVSMEMQIGLLDISVEGGAATLTKQ